MEVGLDRAKMMGRWLCLAMALITSGVNVLGLAAAPATQKLKVNI
jgi:hypothetical protein